MTLCGDGLSAAELNQILRPEIFRSTFGQTPSSDGFMPDNEGDTGLDRG